MAKIVPLDISPEFVRQHQSPETPLTLSAHLLALKKIKEYDDKIASIIGCEFVEVGEAPRLSSLAEINTTTPAAYLYLPKHENSAAKFFYIHKNSNTIIALNSKNLPSGFIEEYNKQILDEKAHQIITRATGHKQVLEMTKNEQADFTNATLERGLLQAYLDQGLNAPYPTRCDPWVLSLKSAIENDFTRIQSKESQLSNFNGFQRAANHIKQIASLSASKDSQQDLENLKAVLNRKKKTVLQTPHWYADHTFWTIFGVAALTSVTILTMGLPIIIGAISVFSGILSLGIYQGVNWFKNKFITSQVEKIVAECNQLEPSEPLMTNPLIHHLNELPSALDEYHDHYICTHEGVYFIEKTSSTAQITTLLGNNTLKTHTTPGIHPPMSADFITHLVEHEVEIEQESSRTCPKI